MEFPRILFEKLPNLKMLAVTGEHHRKLDFEAARERQVTVCRTGIGSGYRSAAELTWGLVLSLARMIPHEHEAMRRGGWQTLMGKCLYGRTLGLVGLGNIGTLMAGYAKSFGMRVVAWSPTLTAERAERSSTTAVGFDEIFRTSDIVSLHLRLAEATRGIVGAREIELMKPEALLINTARGALVDEAALISALERRRIAGAALDVYWNEPLPPKHPIRQMDNVVTTPHLGYLTTDLFSVFYGDTVENIRAFVRGHPINVIHSTIGSA